MFSLLLTQGAVVASKQAVNNMPSTALKVRQISAGKLEDFDTWKPYTGAYRWMLVAGGSSPPGNVKFSARRHAGARAAEITFLHGVSHDFMHMESVDLVKKNLHNVLRDLEMKRLDLLDKIESFFRACRQAGVYTEIGGNIGLVQLTCNVNNLPHNLTFYLLYKLATER